MARDRPPRAPLKFGRGNAKLGGHACPAARASLSKADPRTGRVRDCPETQFRCYAATMEVIPSVRRARWHNLRQLRACHSRDGMARLLLDSLSPFAAGVRVHDSGDFVSRRYFDAWLAVAHRRPGTLFSAYTKSLPFWVARRGHMAPEQVAGQAGKICAWTDVYALGVILFELLTGRLPFEGLNAVPYAMQVLQAERPRPSLYAPHVPSAVDALCLAMMAVEPTHRPATMQEVAARLYSLQAAPAPPAAQSSATDVALRCPHCGKRVRITGSMAGKKVLCPGCKGRIDTPYEVPLPHTTPLQSPLAQTIPTSVGPGLAPVTLVEPVPEEAPAPSSGEVRKVARKALVICAAAVVVFGLLMVVGHPVESTLRILNVVFALITALPFGLLALVAHFVRRSRGTARVVFITSSIMAGVQFPVVVWDYWINDDPKLVGAAVFFLTLFYLVVELFLIPGLVIAKLVRSSQGEARGRTRRPRRATSSQERRG